MARNLDKTTPDDLPGAYRAVWRWQMGGWAPFTGWQG